MKPSILKLAFVACLLTAGSAMSTVLGTNSTDATWPSNAAAIPRYVNAGVTLTALPGNRNVMGVGFLSDGRMVVLSYQSADLGGGSIVGANTESAVYLVSNISAKGSLAAATWTKIVDMLTGPPPGVVVVNDTIYFMDRTAFYRVNSLAPTGGTAKSVNATRIIDAPAADSGYSWGSSGTSWHQYLFAPQYYNGRFYAAYSGSIASGGRQNVGPTSSVTGGVLSWAKDVIVPSGPTSGASASNAGYRKEAGGLRSCNGFGGDGKGTMLIADNQGSFKPQNPIYIYKVGQPMRTYGQRQGHPDNAYGVGTLNQNAPNWAENYPYMPPAIWIPDDVMQSNSQPLYLDRGPYKGDWIMGDVNAPQLGRLHLDDVDSSGRVQGSFHLFTSGIDNGTTGSPVAGATAPGKGINRMAWSPDSAIYVGMIGSRGDWPAGNSPGPMTRISLRDSSQFEVLAIRSRKNVAGDSNGVEIFFSRPLDPATISTSSFVLRQQEVILTANYGCVGSNGRPCFYKVPEITGYKLSNDNRKLFLTIATPDTSIGAAYIGEYDVNNPGRGVLGGAGKQDRTLRVTINNSVRSTGGDSLFHHVHYMAWHFQANKRFNPADSSTSLVAIAGPSRVTKQYQSAIFTRTFAGVLNVRVDLPNAGKFTVGLYSVNGSLVSEQKSTPGVKDYNFNTQNIAQGVHVLRVKQGGNVYSRPVSF